jgi:hypothetical protein
VARDDVRREVEVVGRDPGVDDPTVTDVLPVVMFHAAGALILASPHSWGDRGSFGAASAW